MVEDVRDLQEEVESDAPPGEALLPAHVPAAVGIGAEAVAFGIDEDPPRRLVQEAGEGEPATIAEGRGEHDAFPRAGAEVHGHRVPLVEVRVEPQPTPVLPLRVGPGVGEETGEGPRPGRGERRLDAARGPPERVQEHGVGARPHDPAVHESPVELAIEDAAALGLAVRLEPQPQARRETLLDGEDEVPRALRREVRVAVLAGRLPESRELGVAAVGRGEAGALGRCPGQGRSRQDQGLAGRSPVVDPTSERDGRAAPRRRPRVLDERSPEPAVAGVVLQDPRALRPRVEAARQDVLAEPPRLDPSLQTMRAVAPGRIRLEAGLSRLGGIAREAVGVPVVAGLAEEEPLPSKGQRTRGVAPREQEEVRPRARGLHGVGGGVLLGVLVGGVAEEGEERDRLRGPGPGDEAGGQVAVAEGEARVVVHLLEDVVEVALACGGEP